MTPPIDVPQGGCLPTCMPSFIQIDLVVSQEMRSQQIVTPTAGLSVCLSVQKGTFCAQHTHKITGRRR